MLKEKEDLGNAIQRALEENNISPAQAAKLFGVTPPSITGWFQTGRISKRNFEKLREICKKTPNSHWGLPDDLGCQSAKLSDLEIKLLDAFRHVSSLEDKLEIIGYVKGITHSQQKNMPSLSIPKKPKKAAA